MRPRERRETGEQDLFRSRLDQIIDMSHALVKLARAIDWRVLEERFGSVYTDGPGSPPLPMKPPVGISRRNEFQSTARRGNVSNQSLRPPFVGPRWRIDITGFCSWRS
jgi:hypothetical protein